MQDIKYKTLANNTAPLCFLPSGKLVCYRYGKLLIMQEGEVIKSYRLFSSAKETLLERSKLATRLLRLGIRAAIALDEEHVLLSVGNTIYEFDLTTGKLSNGYYCGKGIRPLIFTMVEGVDGFEDSIVFGGYRVNFEKEPVFIYKRTGVDQWEKVYAFEQGAINHVHNVVPDPYRKCLWVFTGDFDEASAIWKVTDEYKKVERVLCNDQKYRGCVAFALPEGLLYATDAPFADDYIYLMNPETLEMKAVAPISGSCIYGCRWKDKFVFSSTVEEDGREQSKFIKIVGWSRGVGIKDDYVHLYVGNLAKGFKDIYQEKKDIWSYLFQFGVFKFPAGVNNSDTLWFQPVAVRKGDLQLMAMKME